MLTSVRLPERVIRDGEAALRRRLLDRHDIEVGGGLGKLAGSVWRIGLMGENARAEVVDRLLAALDATGRSIVAARYADTVGVPAYFAAAAFAQLLALEPDQGCKRIILAAGDQAAHVDCPEAETDVDTLQDYQSLLERQSMPS